MIASFLLFIVLVGWLYHVSSIRNERWLLALIPINMVLVWVGSKILSKVFQRVLR